MEQQEPQEVGPRPELKNFQQSELFMYAKAKQAWLKDRVSERHLPEAIDQLIEELESTISHTYEGNLPEVTGTALDVSRTALVSNLVNGRYIIDIEPLPLIDDDALFKEHTLQGTLRGFHRGDSNDLRMYMVPQKDHEVHNLMGGIYERYYSVGMEDAEISFESDKVVSLLDEKGKYITSQLSQYAPYVAEGVTKLLTAINTHHTNEALRESSLVITHIAKDPDIPLKFIDALMDVVTIKLQLDTPQDIRASSHRIVLSERPTSAYKANGAGEFFDVVPQLGLLGESANRSLGLFFLYDQHPVQIPVHYITSIRKTQ